ncbi:hypothetical protein ACNKHU_00330 [Shigella flexneri]
MTKRRSGFLIPNAKYTATNYFEFYLPYYWNIAPNIDAAVAPLCTIVVSNVVGERIPLPLPGGRWLDGTGLSAFDKVYEINPNDDSSHDWLFYWNHSGVMNRCGVS